jgi:metal-sulfur cluster biosynthetic enzyme
MLAPLARSPVEQVWQCLRRVTDPELDESVVDMNFVAAVEVDAEDCVHIGFRLPTYWCAANFAFMMADDMRSVVSELPWVRGVDVVLGEHMYADTINHGIAAGLSFRQAFGDEATGDLDEVRRIFLLKAFQRRQEALLRHLCHAGHEPCDLSLWSVRDLVRAPVDEIGARLVERYLERRSVVGPVPFDALAFVTTLGAPLPIAGFSSYLASLRRVRVNAEFNGALCRGLLAAREEMTARPSSAPGCASVGCGPTACAGTKAQAPMEESSCLR